YAQERLLPADRAIKLPDKISYEQAAGMMLKGMTAQYLLRRTFKVEKGQNILVHAAAGGVGLLLCQWGNALGANVIGTVGSEDKAKLAKANGAHHTILYRNEDFVAKVKEITGGKLCDVVYDGIGKTTFPASLDCIKPLGMFVSFGSASGPIEAFNINILQTKGSLFATRPTLNTYVAKREDLLKTANDLFDVVASGAVKIPVNQKYALKDAQKAHRDLEGRGTTGSTILLP
ncbi:MAG: quinone oxidoreductase family protein, partial [Xanthobacteraceae bacterium]